MVLGVDKDLQTRVPELHARAPGAGGERVGPRRARRSRGRRRAWRRRSGWPTSARRPSSQAIAGLDQLGAAHARGAAREGRRARLLDVLLHQLPAHAAARQGLGRGLPRRRPRDRRRAHARVRLRAGSRQRPPRGRATTGSTTPSRSTPTSAPGRRGTTVLAREVLRRPRAATSATPTSARATTRRASASSASCSPRAGCRARVGRDRGRDAERRRRPRRAISATSGSTASSARRSQPDREAEYRIPEFVPLARRSPTAAAGRSRTSASSPARTPACASASTASDVFLVLGTEGDRSPWRSRSTAGGSARATVTQDDLYTLARIPGEKRDHVLDLRFSPGTEAYAFTFG